MRAAPGVRTSPDFPDPRHHEGMGARRPRPRHADGQARARAEARRGSRAHRRRRHLRHRSRDHLARTAGLDRGRLRLQQELHAGSRIHGHGRGPRSRRRRVQDRPARHRGNPRRLRPMQALPRGHVHRLSQLRPQLRRRRQGPPRQRLHHRRRFLRVPGQQHQHAGGDPRQHVGRGGDAGGHRRDRHVRPDRARRAGGRRKRGGDGSGPDRALWGWRWQRRWAPIP